MLNSMSRSPSTELSLWLLVPGVVQENQQNLDLELGHLLAGNEESVSGGRQVQLSLGTRWQPNC